MKDESCCVGKRLRCIERSVKNSWSYWSASLPDFVKIVPGATELPLKKFPKSKQRGFLNDNTSSSGGWQKTTTKLNVSLTGQRNGSESEFSWLVHGTLDGCSTEDVTQVSSSALFVLWFAYLASYGIILSRRWSADKSCGGSCSCRVCRINEFSVVQIVWCLPCDKALFSPPSFNKRAPYVYFWQIKTCWGAASGYRSVVAVFKETWRFEAVESCARKPEAEQELGKEKPWSHRARRAEYL